jgi:hypothetical protein
LPPYPPLAHIFFSAPCFQTSSVYVLPIRDQVSHPYINISKIHSTGWLDIHTTVGNSCENEVPLAKKNAVARHHVLRRLISLHNDTVWFCLFQFLRF